MNFRGKAGTRPLLFALTTLAIGSCARWCDNDDGKAAEETAFEVGLPLSSDQAAMLEGIRSKASGEAVADVFWNGDAISQGAPVPPPRTISPGVRSLGRPEPSPGAPPRPVALSSSAAARRQDSSTSLGVEIRFAIPNDLIKTGEQSLSLQLRAASKPEIVFLQLEKNVRVEGKPGPEAVVQQEIRSDDVKLPDADGDGVSTLQEVSVVLTERGFDQAVSSAQDASAKPTTEEVARATQTLNAGLDSTLKSQDETSGATSSTTAADTTPPDTGISEKPSNPSNSASGSISVTATEAGSTFSCSFDGSAFTACGSTLNYAGLTDGSHTMKVKAKDPAGNEDPTPAEYTWIVDTTAPTSVTVSDGPSHDTDTWSFTDHLGARWTTSSDSGSGLDHYEYAIGTTDCSGSAPDGAKSFTSTGATASMIATGLTLASGTKYFGNVKTFDKAGNSRCDSSDGVTVQ